MELNDISISTVVTPLGKVRCGFKASPVNCVFNDHELTEKGLHIAFHSPDYQVEQFSFKLPIELDGRCITDSHGWLWRVTKITDAVEPIEFYCRLIRDSNIKADSGADCGEALDAIGIDSHEWTMHIGSEDGETLQQRATNDDGMPLRFKEMLDFYNSFTSIEKFMLKTVVPHLEKGERFHIHYLMAYGQRQEGNVDTWLAVDIPKRKIENWLGI